MPGSFNLPLAMALEFVLSSNALGFSISIGYICYTFLVCFGTSTPLGLFLGMFRYVQVLAPNKPAWAVMYKVHTPSNLASKVVYSGTFTKIS